MEWEPKDGLGKVIVTIHERIPRQKFAVCIREGERLNTLCVGSIVDLGDSFVANGEARLIVFRGEDVYFVFNPEDMNDGGVRGKIIPPWMKIL